MINSCKWIREFRKSARIHPLDMYRKRIQISISIWDILVVPDNIFDPRVHDLQQLHVNVRYPEVDIVQGGENQHIGHEHQAGYEPVDDPEVNRAPAIRYYSQKMFYATTQETNSEFFGVIIRAGI